MSQGFFSGLWNWQGFGRISARCWRDVGLLKDWGRTLYLERFERILGDGFWRDVGRFLVRCWKEVAFWRGFGELCMKGSGRI